MQMRGASLPWRSWAERWGVFHTELPLLLVPVLGMLRRPVRRQLMRRQLDERLRFLGRPATRPTTVRIAPPCLIPAAKHLLAVCLRSQGLLPHEL
eukprot:6503504-Alexandrium_andersonii.AAC.1